MKFLSNLDRMWQIWAKALGEKAHQNDRVADQVATIRTIIFATYLITNCFIVAGVIRHWNEREIKVEVQVYEDQNNYKKSYSERWNDMGMGGDQRIKGFYDPTKNKNFTGEYE